MTEKLKVCLLGATGVGKTSLVARYVRSIFDERYRTTIGVSIERRDLARPEGAVQLVIWDMSGEDEFQTVQLAYLRGAAGYILVVDGTRPDTIETARSVQARAQGAVGGIPCIVAINKVDLADTWELTPGDRARLDALGWPVVYTSAKTGDGVEQMFERLVDAIHGPTVHAWI